MPEIPVRPRYGGGLVAALVALAIPAAASAAPYASARTCAACHQTLHTYWSESAHARSATSPLFVESLRAASAQGDAAKRSCVFCHAPTAPGSTSCGC